MSKASARHPSSELNISRRAVVHNTCTPLPRQWLEPAGSCPTVSTPTIEAPTEEDINSIAQAIVHAQHVTTEVLGAEMDGTRADLTLIQRLLDTGMIERESTYTLQALGLAFGRAFVHENKAFDWWIVHDGRGRDPVLRYRDSSLLAFPKTMLSKRIRDGESLDVVGLFDQLAEQLSQLIARGYGSR